MSISTPQTDTRQTQTTNFSIYPTNGWFVVVDEPITGTTPVFSQLTVTVPGSVIVTTGNNNFRYFPLMAAGAVYPAAGLGVVSAATIDGVPVTTTATGIWAHGGL